MVVVSVSELQEGVTTGGHQQTLNGILRNQTFGKVENSYYCHLLTKAVAHLQKSRSNGSNKGHGQF